MLELIEAFGKLGHQQQGCLVIIILILGFFALVPIIGILVLTGQVLNVVVVLIRGRRDTDQEGDELEQTRK